MTLLRASVTATSPTEEGGPAEVLPDGSDSPVTANGLTGYTPYPGDRLLIEVVGSQVEILQFLAVTNGLANAGFEDGVLAPHQIYNGAVFSAHTATVHNGTYSGSFALPISAGWSTFLSTQGVQNDPEGKHPRVKVGDEWGVSAWVRFGSGPTVRAQITVRDASGAVLQTVTGAQITTNATWQQISASVVVTDPAASYVVGTLQWTDPATKTVLVDDMLLQRKVPSVMIADELVGKTVTGGKFRTAVTGQRWEIDSAAQNEIRGYSVPGFGTETIPGRIVVDVDPLFEVPMLKLLAARYDDGFGPVDGPEFYLKNSGSSGTEAGLDAGAVYFSSGGVVLLSLLDLGATGLAQFAVEVGATAGITWKLDGLSNPLGRKLNSMDFGISTGLTTDASSRVALTHNLGVAVGGHQLTSRDGRQYTWISGGATSAVIEVRTAAGVLVGSGVSTNFGWTVLA